MPKCKVKTKKTLKKEPHQKAAEDFKKIFKELGDALSEVFDDPKLKNEVKKISQSAVKSAKAFGERFKDKEVREKFKKAGKTAQNFSKEVEKIIKNITKKSK